MKNFIFLLLGVFTPCFSQAQLALVKENGASISNGQIFTYNTTNESSATLYYKIKNTSSSAVNVRIKILSIQNGTGSGFQFCYLNTCLPSVALNAVYPSNSNTPITINGNSETPASGYNMWNSNTGSGTFPIDYTVKFYLVDDFNNEYGTPVTIVYRYDPNAMLATDEAGKKQKQFASVSSTLFKSNISIISKENITYRISNMEGRIVLQGNLKKGDEAIDTSTMNTGTYIISLQNDHGKLISEKIIKND
ncbi:T9SS type A sorting domain-containing protein [Chryseobacterium herbae]|uniref:T9SS type A sorting domain-containing protein n=1 Tax=Chryseobacterium herbae TaxID=2976476 RepID=A0ABT2IV63_9FLAO|nr:T9SS type A sorting domain-containing protein [Chryseobacterium sp. pc1-10]MCT2562702.1 T9SS type A sorting domain-containing protein [Chryseobacterium sp. pc1-10]